MFLHLEFRMYGSDLKWFRDSWILGLVKGLGLKVWGLGFVFSVGLRFRVERLRDELLFRVLGLS